MSIETLLNLLDKAQRSQTIDPASSNENAMIPPKEYPSYAELLPGEKKTFWGGIDIQNLSGHPLWIEIAFDPFSLEGFKITISDDKQKVLINEMRAETNRKFSIKETENGTIEMKALLFSKSSSLRRLNNFDRFV